jgi:hypothetical protein
MVKSRRMRWVGHVAHMARRGTPEVKRPLGRPRYTWENNIRIDPGEAGWGGMDWIDLA